MREAQEFAQAAMASAQQQMEEYANRSRKAAEELKVGDLVWLNLRNVQTPQLSKKLSWINAKYRVKRVLGSHHVELNVPGGIFPKFHVDLLKRAPEDPLPSQRLRDDQPPPLIPQTEDQDAEWEVDEILRARRKRVGRGSRREVLVKWTGYQDPTWEPRAELRDTEALSRFEAVFGDGDNVGYDTGTATGRKTTHKNLRTHDILVQAARCLQFRLV
jgi:hypothetical protein